MNDDASKYKCLINFGLCILPLLFQTWLLFLSMIKEQDRKSEISNKSERERSMSWPQPVTELLSMPVIEPSIAERTNDSETWGPAYKPVNFIIFVGFYRDDIIIKGNLGNVHWYILKLYTCCVILISFELLKCNYWFTVDYNNCDLVRFSSVSIEIIVQL